MARVVELTNGDERRAACVTITAVLPDWFGLADANARYADDAAQFPALAIQNETGDITGLLVYRTLTDDVLDTEVVNIHWLGVLPDTHHQGQGRLLVNALKDKAQTMGADTLTVETLDPAVQDEAYLKTYAFYRAMGFASFHRFAEDSPNPMVRMRCDLSCDLSG